ncbi:MAG: trehalose utilization protein ThuA, partial [Acetatifactor sp.]|nr:trehalose utilization protein ThuA [Acetatifactor sp.]
MTRVTVWNEYVHEQEYENIRTVYPEGIHGCIAGVLGKASAIQVRTAPFSEPEHGLTEEVLAQTDVLIFWSHA